MWILSWQSYRTGTGRNKVGVHFTLMCVSLDGFYFINITNSCHFCCATRYSNSFSGGPELIIYHSRNYQLKWSMVSSCLGRCSLKSMTLTCSLLLSMWKEKLPTDLVHFLPLCWVQRVWTRSVVRVPLHVRGTTFSATLSSLCWSYYALARIHFPDLCLSIHRLPRVNHCVMSCFLCIYIYILWHDALILTVSLDG
jgi:hypothetical protein